MILTLKFLTILIISILWRIGGTNKKSWARDVIIPIILGAWIGIESVWWVGLLSVGSFQIIRIGYGAYDPEHDDKPSFLGGFLKDGEGSLTRALAGFIYGIIGALPLTVYLSSNVGAVVLWDYFMYSLTICVFSYGLSKLKAKDFIIEPLIGAMVGLIVFFN